MLVTDKSKWLLDYGADQDSGAKPYNDAKTPAAKKIVKKNGTTFCCTVSFMMQKILNSRLDTVFSLPDLKILEAFDEIYQLRR